MNSNGAKWIRRERRLAIYLRDGLACAYCGATLEDGAQLTLDHVIPRSDGGGNRSDNLVTACTRCNRARGNRDQHEFIVSVAQYLNHGVDAEQIIGHIADCLSRKLDMKVARSIIAKRPNWASTLANLRDS